jgi:signal transduction histidine kinase
MQAYFVPILIAAFQFGVRGGLGVALAVSLIYVPHISIQWTGNTEHILLGFLQIIMFNIIGLLTGLKAQREKEEKIRYQHTARELQQSLEKIRQQSEKLSEFEEQLRLLDRLAIVGELTASLAHEVRNPLGSIRGTVEILREELPAEFQHSDFFRILVEETERLNSVVEDYLNFARKPKQPLTQFDIREIIQDTGAILLYKARKEGIRFHTDLPGTPVIVEGDPNHLRQIVMNLLFNAIQAMPGEGSIWIIGELQNYEEMNPGLPGGSKDIDDKYPALHLRIRDEGTGITSEDLEKIFNPFYTTKSNGTGLGLSIVKRIVDDNHWKINVTSEPGKGSEFVLVIPLKK